MVKLPRAVLSFVSLWLFTFSVNSFAKGPANSKSSDFSKNKQMLLRRFLATTGENFSPIKLSLQDSFQDSNWLFTQNKKYDGPKSLEEMAQMKIFEADRKFTQCAELGFGLFKKNLEFQGWIASQSLDCLNQEFQNEKNVNFRIVRSWETLLESKPELFAKGTWRLSLWQQYMKLLQNLIRSEKNPQRIKDINRAIGWKELMTAQERSDLYKQIANFGLKQKQKESAAIYFQRSFNLSPSEEVRSQLLQMQPTVINQESTGGGNEEDTSESTNSISTNAEEEKNLSECYRIL